MGGLISPATMLFHPANFFYWTLLAMGVVCFLLIIVSGVGDSDVDVGMETEADIEVDAEADIEADADELSVFQVLSWLGFGKAPLMLLLAIDFSTWGMTGWTVNTFVGNLTGTIPNRLFGLGGLILLGSFVFSLAVGSVLSRPIGHIFAPFSEDVSSERLIGCIGTVTSKKLPYLAEGKIGQVDVYDATGNLVSISAALPQQATFIPHRGQQVLIIDQYERGYVVIAKDTSDEDKWMISS